MIALLVFVFILGGFIIYFTFALTIFIPLGILLSIDTCLIKKTFRALRQGGKTVLWIILLIIAGISTYFLGKISIEKFSEAWLGKNSMHFEISDISDESKYYKISMHREEPYKPEKNIIRIQEYIWDGPNNKSILISNDKYIYTRENVGQRVVEEKLIDAIGRKTDIITSRHWRPCFFEYSLSNEKGKYNGKLLRIGLKDENGVPIKEKRIINSSRIPGGTIDQIGGSDKSYILFR